MMNNTGSYRYNRDYLTVVFRGVTRDEAESLIFHPKMSASSWSHAIQDRDAAMAASIDKNDTNNTSTVPTQSTDFMDKLVKALGMSNRPVSDKDILAVITQMRDLINSQHDRLQKEGNGKSDQEIVDEAIQIANELLLEFFNSKVTNPSKIYANASPAAKSCWNAACYIIDVLTQSDVENALSNYLDEN